ncbi:hypothetical protein TNCV_3976601 [Trichonephila clavipes]|nr:hypothetical protein TNCV_3976601 [Trichonephila clavipes]
MENIIALCCHYLRVLRRIIDYSTKMNSEDEDDEMNDVSHITYRKSLTPEIHISLFAKRQQPIKFKQVLEHDCVRNSKFWGAKIQSIHSDRKVEKKSLSNFKPKSLNSRVGSIHDPRHFLLAGVTPGSPDRNPTPLVRVNNRPTHLISTPKQTCVQHLVAITRPIIFSLSVRL